MSDLNPYPVPHLTFEMKHALGALTIDAAFELTQPWTVLFGPSGSGKSTILRAIAGFIRPDQARITLTRDKHPQVLAKTDAGISIPPHKRPVRWAAQTPALFPHMTVRGNLAFASAIGSPNSQQAIEDAMQCFRITPLEDRRPVTLSGGEQQRVSIARAAIGANGRLLLLDEPFSGLDTPLRDELLTSLQQWLAETHTPVLSVTHDAAEALLLKAEVIKLREGRVIAQGAAHLVLAEERLRLLSQLNADA